ncbi:hypothetical protein LCGC14_2851980, partial [marine sediment metagenome]
MEQSDLKIMIHKAVSLSIVNNMIVECASGHYKATIVLNDGSEHVSGASNPGLAIKNAIHTLAENEIKRHGYT